MSKIFVDSEKLSIIMQKSKYTNHFIKLTNNFIFGRLFDPGRLFEILEYAWSRI